MKLNQIVRKIVNNKISEIHTSLPAKIEKYDPVKMRAEVVLLAKKELEGEKVEIPPIVEVPVALLKAGPFVIRQPFQKGDPVVVAFGEKAIDKLLLLFPSFFKTKQAISCRKDSLIFSEVKLL